MSIPKHEIICGIYKITSPSGRIYIGQSVDILENWRMRYINKRTRHNQHALYSSLNKYGRQNHKFEIIEVCTKEHLDYYEIYYIWIYNTFNSKRGMNLTMGGGGNKGLKHTEETKIKISTNSKGLQNCLGNKLTEEHKRNIGAAHKGMKRPPEMCEKLRLANLGKKLSEATKDKIRKHNNTPEYKEYSRNLKLGKPRSAEVIQKMSESANKLILLNLETGIYYLGLRDAALTVGLTHKYLGKMLCGFHRNTTSFIKV